MKTPPLPFAVRSMGKTTTFVDLDVRGDHWEQPFLLSADRHFDNPDSDLCLQKAHLAEARDRRAGILDFGDLFCGMQGKMDKRGSKEKLRPEHAKSAYFDELVGSGIDLLAPYAPNLIVIGRGNHETSILRIHETDLSARLVQGLRAKGSPVVAGGYSGFVRFLLNRGNERHSYTLYYHHGSGGGGIVTKGVIAANRRAAHVNADIYVSGHVHESWVLEVPRTTCTASGAVVHREGWHVQIPSYKEEYKDGDGGYHVENGRPAKPIGAYWMTLYRRRGGRGYGVEFTKARN